MDGAVSFLLDILESLKLSEVSIGLEQLEKLLLQLLPEMKQYQNNGTMSSDLDDFIKLQDNFGFNLTSCLVKLYRRNLSKSDIVLLNRNLQGLLLLHPPSKTVFNREANMQLILDLLDKDDDKLIIITTITTLIHILLKNYDNYRSFESNNGCPMLIHHLSLASVYDIEVDGVPQPSSLGKSKSLYSIEQLLNFKIIEFLMLYMSEEIGNPDPHTVEMKSDLFRDEFPAIDLLIESLSELDKL